jgi:nitrate/nitrite-specific signal transduction histidine kinase
LEDIPVIFLTARDDIEGIVEGFAAGGLDYITKPFKKEEVLVRARTHLERALLARNLAELNAHLEQKVAERTREVQLRLKELEGKDRIAQHLLTFNTLEETLAVVLEVTTSVLKLDSAAIFLREEGELLATAAIGLTERDAIIGRSELSKLSFAPNAAAAAVLDQKSSTVVADADPPIALIPILRDEDLLGLIQVENQHSKREITDADLKTLTSFALQSAVAITDAKVRQDPEAWRDQLDEILEIDKELEDAEALDGLSAEDHD